MPFFLWSRTPANNGTADPTCPWPEGMAPAQVNDSARGNMARLREFADDIAGAIVTAGTSSACTVASYETFDTLAHLGGNVLAFTPHTGNASPVTLNKDFFGEPKIWLNTYFEPGKAYDQPGGKRTGGAAVSGPTSSDRLIDPNLGPSLPAAKPSQWLPFGWLPMLSLEERRQEMKPDALQKMVDQTVAQLARVDSAVAGLNAGTRGALAATRPFQTAGGR